MTIPVSSILNCLLGVVYPPRCVACAGSASDGYGQVLCSRCSQRVQLVRSPCCPNCGRPYPLETEDHLCWACQEAKPAFERARAWASYSNQEEENPLRDAISLFKYQRRVSLAKPFATFMTEVSKANRLECDLILPVPLHPDRLRWRGFNQSLLLARHIGKALQIGVDAFSLVRERNTQPQVELSAIERQRNVREAFRLTRRSGIVDRRVLLVDDVYTSGATVRECAMVLKEGGAKEIHVLTLARAM